LIKRITSIFNKNKENMASFDCEAILITWIKENEGNINNIITRGHFSELIGPVYIKTALNHCGEKIYSHIKKGLYSQLNKIDILSELRRSYEKLTNYRIGMFYKTVNLVRTYRTKNLSLPEDHPFNESLKILDQCVMQKWRFGDKTDTTKGFYINMKNIEMFLKWMYHIPEEPEIFKYLTGAQSRKIDDEYAERKGIGKLDWTICDNRIKSPKIREIIHKMKTTLPGELSIKERAQKRIAMIIDEDDQRTIMQRIIDASIGTIFEGKIIDLIKIFKELSNCVAEYWQYVFHTITLITDKKEDMTLFDFYSKLKGGFLNDILLTAINDPVFYIISPYGDSEDKFRNFIGSFSIMFNDDITQIEEWINFAIENKYETFTEGEFEKLGCIIDKFVSIYQKI
jgi:hypothetical protein